ncbi:hypothetical protein JXB41_08785 [Candidatus Woesearchaeota archaeon]|nr:hypothetical protein [Candidatus Woesearchaeota archaeon]
MKKSQIISMDLVLGFIIYMIALSVFFYALGGIPFLKQRKTLNIEADFVFSNIENIQNNRINFLENYEVNENKLKLFANISYKIKDTDSDGLSDYGEEALISKGISVEINSPDSDFDNFTDFEELRRGTLPNNSLIKPRDNDVWAGNIIGDSLDDYWEEKHGIDDYDSPDTLDYAYEDIDGDSFFDNPNDWGPPYSPSDTECNLPYEYRMGHYNEDYNSNDLFDGTINTIFTGFWLDNTKLKKCTPLGFYPDYYCSDDSGDYKRCCQKCIPNIWAYSRDLKKGDFDNDGLNDINEINIYTTNPFEPEPDNYGFSKGAQLTMDILGISFSDDDSDYLPDKWEEEYDLNVDSIECAVTPFGDSCKYGDPDDDYLSNWEELKYGTDPMNPDTNGNGINDFYEPIKPLQIDLQSLILGDIDTHNFKEIDVCIYFEDKNGDIKYHVGEGDVDDNMIYIKEEQKCGQESFQVINAKPECLTSPYVETIVMSKPVLYKTDLGAELLNMRILICAKQ